jgi:AbrB family looped-hinge helix DNA binding protein
MSGYEKPDVTVVSEKGQVVIPKAIREKLGIGPKTKLLIYSYQDAVVMKKIEIPDVAKELEEIYRKVDAKIAKYGELSDEEINEIIQEYRGKKRAAAKVIE